MAQAQKSSITLQGSAQMISEFLDFGINSILYQRDVYPPDEFSSVKKYGLTVLMAQDAELRKYLDEVLKQMRLWIEDSKLNQVVLVVKGCESDETLERWSFEIEKSEELKKGKTKVEADIKEIQKGIKDVVKQIVSTVTFLPAIEEPVMFDLLFYCVAGVDLENWDPNSSHLITGDSDSVKLRSWSSKIHTVNTAVTFKTN